MTSRHVTHLRCRFRPCSVWSCAWTGAGPAVRVSAVTADRACRGGCCCTACAAVVTAVSETRQDARSLQGCVSTDKSPYGVTKLCLSNTVTKSEILVCRSVQTEKQSDVCTNSMCPYVHKFLILDVKRIAVSVQYAVIQNWHY